MRNFQIKKVAIVFAVSSLIVIALWMLGLLPLDQAVAY